MNHMKKINNFAGTKLNQYGKNIHKVIGDDVNYKLTIKENLYCFWQIICAIPMLILLFVTDYFT